MHRTEGANNVSNLFTDGPPGTTVEEDWLNAIQEEIANVIEEAGLTLQTANTETRDQLKLALDLLYSAPNGSMMTRARFTYNGGAVAYTIKISNGSYRVKEKVAQWTSELTTSAIPAPGAGVIYYLYLYYPNIISGTEITSAELVWSSAAPTYSQTYGGWYAGDSLCIFACKINSGPTNILEFFHDGGDLVAWSTSIQEATTLTPSNVYTDVDMATSMPAFVTKAHIFFNAVYVDTELDVFIRPNGASESGGRKMGRVSVNVENNDITTDINTDASQIIEVKFDGVTAGNYINVFNNGWYFPVGM